MRNLFFYLMLSGLFSAAAFGQGIEAWTVYSSYTTVNDLETGSSGEIYAATLGGLYTVRDGQIEQTFTTIDGMYRLDPTHLVFSEAESMLVLAYSNGVLDIFEPESQGFTQIEDISRVDEFNSKRINDVLTHNGRLYAATDFGIVVFDLATLLVENNYLRFGEFSRGTAVNALEIVGDSIFCATNEGVATASLSDNLSDNSAWETYNEADGLPMNVINDIVYFQGDFYVVSNEEVYVFNAGTWAATNEFGGGSVKGFERSPQELAVMFNNRVFIRTASGTEQVIPAPNSGTVRSFNIGNSNYYLGTLAQGYFEITKESGEVIGQLVPDGPFLNFFNDLQSDESGLITSTLDAFPRSGDPFAFLKSYSILKEDGWYNFNQTNRNELQGFWEAYEVGSTSENYYIGSWGKGVVRHNKETDEITLFNAANTGLSGIPNDRNYVVISGLDSDFENNIWAVSFLSNLPLNVQRSGSDEWIHFEKVGISGSDQYFDLFIDSNDQKWISLIDISENGRGLLVLDTNDPEDPDDDSFKKLTTGLNNGNLPDEKVKAVVEDKNGEIWIGTGRGIARFIFPEFIVASTNPSEYRAQWLINEDTTALSRFLLRDVNVSDIAVNAANEKWIGSVNQGIWVLNEEGSRIQRRYTKENSPLISNSIKSITIDQQSGEVFISTDLGMVSFLDVPKAPVNEMDKLKIFPNPFTYARHSQIVIEGLNESTQLKILGVDGKIVQELSARGGRVSWNGLDYQGRQLGSGVYVIVALDREGSEKGIGKVVIVR